MMRRWPLLAVVACAALAGCKRSPSPAPQPGNELRITGTERAAWNQQAADRAELQTFRYAMYVDGARNELNDVSCATEPGAEGFACTSRLPPLSLGAHSLEIAAFVVDEQILESGRTAPLRVLVVGAAAAASAVSASASTVRIPATLAMRVERLADGLDDPTDAIFAPDGRLFIAERRGRILVVRGTALATALQLDDVATDGDNGLLALAIDPLFDRTHFVFLVYTTASHSGPVFRLARFREVNGELAERAILLDEVPASAARAGAAMRFGGDGKLYVAFDAGGEEGRAGDASAYGGKVLRLNADGSTPADQPAASPIFGLGLHSPRAMDWQPGTGRLWIAGRDAQDLARVRRIRPNDVREARASEGSAGLSPATGASSVAFYRGDLFPALRGDLLVAGRDAPGIERIRLDRDPNRIASSERLLDGAGGIIRALAVGPDGAIYFCSESYLARLVPGR